MTARTFYSSIAPQYQTKKSLYDVLQQNIKKADRGKQLSLHSNVEEDGERSTLKENRMRNRFSFVRVKQGQIAGHNRSNEKSSRQVTQDNTRIRWIFANYSTFQRYRSSRWRLKKYQTTNQNNKISEQS